MDIDKIISLWPNEPLFFFLYFNTAMLRINLEAHEIIFELLSKNNLIQGLQNS